ncbi:MAG: glycoside hydrolase family protein, partial [Cyanobacteria bacterium J06649_4]
MSVHQCFFTGNKGPQTWQVAFSETTSQTTPYPGTPIRYSAFEPLRFDAQVQQVQQRLIELGWQIEADGFFGPKSAIAIQRFQTQNSIDADSIIGPMTWAAIFDSSAPMAPTEQNLKPAADIRRINTAGLELIKSFEGLRLNSYRDAVGVWTIGYGHTRTAGPGQRITFEQATNLLRGDVATFEKAVTQAVRVPITGNQFAALVSFAYNVGSGALSSSTLLR